MNTGSVERVCAVCYPRAIDLFWLGLSLVAIVALALVVMLGFGRMAWRILRGGEEMEPGGSYSRQSFGRYKQGQMPEKEPE